jgi:hypothetical protein
VNFLSSLGLMSATAGLVALASPVQADQHDVTAEEVEAYYEQVAQEATEMVRADELARMIEWIDDNIADGAVLQASLSVLHGDQRKGFAAMTLEKEDMRAMGGVFAGAFQQQEIEDFSLEIEVTEVISHGPGAATVRAVWPARISVAVPAGEGAEPGGDALSVEQVADCTQVLQRDGERLQMGLTTCTGEVRL